MVRTKSPKYPNFPLGKAIDYAAKIRSKDGFAPLHREVIAKHLGYSGISGASDSVIATMAQYGLLERVAKGEMKLSQTARDILLPESEESRFEAIRRAAFSPPLFAEIRSRSDGLPSGEWLQNYLLRRDFHERAVTPVIRAFSETCAMLEKPSESDSDGQSEDDAPESVVPAREGAVNGTVAGATMEHATLERSRSDVIRSEDAPRETAELNKIKTQFDEETVRISAWLDRDGIRQLEKRIKAIKLMLDIEDENRQPE